MALSVCAYRTLRNVGKQTGGRRSHRTVQAVADLAATGAEVIAPRSVARLTVFQIARITELAPVASNAASLCQLYGTERLPAAWVPCTKDVESADQPELVRFGLWHMAHIFGSLR